MGDWHAACLVDPWVRAFRILRLKEDFRCEPELRCNV